MKKPILLFILSLCMTLSYGQETIFLETCGNTDATTSKKVEKYVGWDNAAPVTFTRTMTLDGAADVRSTSATTNHVWFPSGKSSDLIISNINCSGFHQLSLSFNMAAYKLADANVNKMNLSCNDSTLTLPSITFQTSKFDTVSNIKLGNSRTVTLHFEFTAQNNANGYRLDNIKITGIKAISSLSNVPYLMFNPIVSGRNLLLKNFEDGTPVDLYSSTGSRVQSSIVKAGYIVLNSRLATGLYIVRAGGYSGKVLLFFS